MTLQEYLEAEGVTVTEFAATLGISRGTVHNWMSGLSNPTHAKIVKIREVTGGNVQPVDWFPESEAAE